MVKSTPKSSLSHHRRRRHNSVTSSVVVSSLLSGSHGRKRRNERQISKTDLQLARRYGMAEPARFGRTKHTYAGKVFIYDPARNQEVTSYLASDAIGIESGSRAVTPILQSKRPEFLQPEALAQHEQVKVELLLHHQRWKSHSVLVVDMSGSMRRDDVSGARCRSDAVWMALARDYIQRRLEEGSVTRHDVVSVIVMRDTAHVMLSGEPMSWVLFNKFVDYREWQNLRPSGAGCYLPALEKAEDLLQLNPLGSCSLALMFFSDGRPTDRSSNFAKKMGAIAARYGNRLSVSCIGMAEQSENFDSLRDMVKEADAFGARARFERPSLDTGSLSTAVSSLATSLARSKIALTSLAQGRGRQKTVRTDFVRERKDDPDDVVPTDDWQVYHNTSDQNYVRRLWTWDRERDDFVYLVDSRCIFCNKTVLVGTRPSAIQLHGKAASTAGAQCPDCKGCFICVACMGRQEHRGTPKCLAFLSDRRTKAMVHKQVPSFAVAMKKFIFGEGAERVVRKFRFLDDKDDFVGKRWVAKESRFIDDDDDEKDNKMDSSTANDEYQTKMAFHREFARTQVLASDFARKLNEALDNLENHFDPSHHGWLRSLPRFRFLEPLVVELMEDGKERNILIEEMLEGRYQKFNNNMGYVLDQQSVAFPSLKENDTVSLSDDSLSVIEEEESMADETEVDELNRVRKAGIASKIFSKKQTSPLPACHYLKVRPEDFPQAFSHFSYKKSRKRLMVVDLQGILVEYADGRKEYVLTDPAIHKRKKKGAALSRLGHLGRTDRGEKGMQAFFETHICTDACSLLGLVQKIE